MTTVFKRSYCIIAVILCLLYYSSCRTVNPANLTTAEFEEMIMDSSKKYGFTEKMLGITDSIYRAYPNASLDFKLKHLSYACGYYHITKRDEDSAMIYADSMLTLVKNRDDKEKYFSEEALANISKGDILFSQRYYREAYQYYYLARVAAEKSPDQCTYSEYNYRLAMVSYKQTNYRLAAHDFIRAFEQSNVCAEDYRNTIRRQELLNNIALSYQRAEMPDSSIFYHKKTVEFLTAHKNIFTSNLQFYETAMGVTYGAAARAYAVIDSSKAEAFFAKSIAINDKPGYDNNDALLTQLSLVSFYMQYNRHQDVWKTLQAAKTGLDSLRNKEAGIEWNHLMWKYYQQQHDDVNAYKHLVVYENLQKEQAQLDKQLARTNISREIESLQAAYDINLLKKDKKLNNIYLLVLGAGIVLTGLILYLIWQNWRKSKKLIVTLRSMNTRISEQKAALDLANDQLQQQIHEKDAILRVVAHDLRNPISGIYASLNYLDKPEKLPAHEMEFVNLMQIACSDALTLIGGLLEVTGHSDKNADLSRNKVSINSIIYHCVQLLLFKAAEKQQVIDIDFYETDFEVMVQEEQIRRVVNNLLTNAIKFSHTGANIHISTQPDGNFVRIAVKDNGIGIPEKLQPIVFDVSTNAKRYGTDEEKPFGLGLSICKKIIENHKGHIWLESSEGEGTVFYFKLPLVSQLKVEN